MLNSMAAHGPLINIGRARLEKRIEILVCHEANREVVVCDDARVAFVEEYRGGWKMPGRRRCDGGRKAKNRPLLYPSGKLC